MLSLESFDIFKKNQEFSDKSPEVFENVSHYHAHVRKIVSAGGIVPHDIAISHRFIPRYTVDSIQEIAWEINKKNDINAMYDLVIRLVNGNMKLWHLTISDDLKHVFVDEPYKFHGSYLMLSHIYVWKRLVCDEFKFANGMDGSLKPVREF
jgi:hypothetical protein